MKAVTGGEAVSTCYMPLKKIAGRDLFDGRLEAFGICEVKSNDTTENHKCLTDGKDYLWVFIGDKGFVGPLKVFGINDPLKILRVIASAFGTNIVSEHEPQYGAALRKVDHVFTLSVREGKVVLRGTCARVRWRP
jgi:hypothetical protein